MTVYKGTARIGDLASNLFIGVSARRLLSTPTIDLCTLRENVGDDENTFQLPVSSSYLDTGAVDTFLDGANGFFVEWYDQVNNTRKFNQTTLSRQPLYVENGINGKVALKSEVSATSKLRLSLGIDKHTAATYFCPCYVEATQGGGASIFSNNDSLVANSFFVSLLSSGLLSVRIVNSAGGFEHTGSIAISTGTHLIRVECDGIRTLKCYVDGVLSPTLDVVVAGGFTNRIDQPQVGVFNGLIPEFLIWDRILRFKENTRVEANINNFYNI